ncbi:MAG: hypothetical protein AVDCRST_MAG10-2197, partial [uncultured Acidimicrobiales bacterium]
DCPRSWAARPLRRRRCPVSSWPPSSRRKRRREQGPSEREAGTLHRQSRLPAVGAM